MSTTTLPRGAARVGYLDLRGPLLLLAVSIAAFFVSRHGMTHLGRHSVPLSSAAVVAAVAAVLPFRRLRYAQIPAPSRITMRCIGAIVLVQMLFDALGPFAGPPNILFGGDAGAVYVRYTAILGLAAGLAAVWRPVFLVPLFLYYVGWRELIGTVTGIGINDTDYLGMVDLGYLAVIGAMIVAGATAPVANGRIGALQRRVLGRDDRQAIRTRACNLIWACGVGAHLGSYFWSGMAKIDAGGADKLMWMLHNPTETAITLGLDRGDNPLAAWPWLLQAVSDGIVAAQPLPNIVVLASQILSPLAALSLPTLALFCLFFDIFHVVVYLTLGALFLFWIAVNLIVVASAASLRPHGFTLPMKIVMALSTLFGHYFFYTNQLGWLDSAQIISAKFYAVTRDQREVEVPGGYFGVHSYPIGQGGMYVPDDHFPFRVGGNAHDPETWQRARHCDPRTVPHQDTGISLDAVRQMVRHADALMRRLPAVKSYNLYYFYPQHLMSDPWMYTAFNDLAIDDIIAYDYVVDSVCLSVEDGSLVRDVHKHSVIRIDLR